MDEALKPLNGLAAILVAAFLISVVMKGNDEKLRSELMKERGFLEFLVSVFILKWASEKDTSGMIKPIIFVATLTSFMALAGKVNFVGTTAKFAKGEIGLFDALKGIVGNV